MTQWRIDVLPDGRIATLHHDTVAQMLKQLGTLHVTRLTEVEFDATMQQWRITPVMGQAAPVKLFRRFEARRNALAHEIRTLTEMPLSYGELL